MIVTSGIKITNPEMRLRRGLAHIASRRAGFAHNPANFQNTVAENVCAPKCPQKHKSENKTVTPI